MAKHAHLHKIKIAGNSLLEQLLVLSVITSLLLSSLSRINHLKTSIQNPTHSQKSADHQQDLSRVLLRIPRGFSGFTLIELLCVIAILASFLTLSIRYSRDFLWDRRLTNTAIEMENVLAAALNYQYTNQTWPEFHDQLNQCWQQAPDKNKFILDYMPLKNRPHQLGEFFCYGASHFDAPRFWVALHLNKQNYSLAPRLLARLANSYLSRDPNDPNEPPCDEQNCFVIVRSSAHPGAGQQFNKSLELVGTGQCQSEHNETAINQNTQCDWQANEGTEPKMAVFQIHFTCPKGYVKTLSASLNYLDVGKARGEPYVLRSVNLASDCHWDYGCQLTIQAARSDNHSVTTGAHGHVGAAYWAYCQRGSNESSL